MKLTFLLTSNIYIYGKTAFALLFSKFDISQQSKAFNNDVNLRYKFEDSFHTVKQNAEIAMGFCYNKFFNKGEYLLSIKAGYEFHQWWNQNQARKFFDKDPSANDTTSRGDLSFNGFAFALALDF